MDYPNADLAAQRYTYWIERLESQAEAFLRDTSCEELPPKERFNLAIKYLTLLHRFLLLTQKSDLNASSNDAQHVLDSLRAHMRGDLTIKTEIDIDKS